VGTDP